MGRLLRGYNKDNKYNTIKHNKEINRNSVKWDL